MKKRIKSKRKKVFLIAVLVIIIIIILSIINSIKRITNNDDALPYEIVSAQELLKYYNCENITIKDSQEELFKTDIYLKFGEDLCLNGKTNEAYYKAITLYLTEILEYKNYRMIDSSRELVVAVIANSKDKKIEKLYINGQLDYFEKEQTKQIIEKHEPTEITELEIQAKEIKKYIANGWEAEGINLGTLESRFKGYDIYFDEGIEVKTLGGKVYNLVFTDKYQGNIINNLKVNAEKEKVVQALGKPVFENKNVFGYKSDKMYVFFSENQVSVYRIEDDYKTEEFLTIWEEFQGSKDAKKFVNDLTNLWQDHNEYQYDSDMIYLEYAIKGIKVQFNISSENGIVLYKNYKGELQNGITLENVNTESLPKHMYIHKEDLVFEQETERVSAKMRYTSEEYMNTVNENYFLEEENGTFCFNEKESKLFYLEYQYVLDEGIREIKFISKNNEYPNSELIRHIQIYTYGWINDEQFVYSISKQGIYCYNAKTRKLKTLITGNENYEIKEVIGDILFYDNTNIKLK